MQILVSNDDSHDSPLLALLLERLASYGTLHLVVPAEEQSWQGKSMTRYGQLGVSPVEIAGVSGHAVTGTPADCVNLGMFSLMNTRPDLVVSGINIGSNVGLGFAMASGTLGACLEGNIAGVPGLALSQTLQRATYHRWSSERRFDDAELQQLADQLDRTLPRIWERCVTDHHGEPVTMSVNLPAALQDPEPVPTVLARSSYGGCFQPADSGFRHQIKNMHFDDDPASDAAVVGSGRVSATLLDLSTLGQQAGFPSAKQA
jgi:5'-nucleotidase